MKFKLLKIATLLTAFILPLNHLDVAVASNNGQVKTLTVKQAEALKKQMGHKKAHRSTAKKANHSTKRVAHNSKRAKSHKSTAKTVAKSLPAYTTPLAAKAIASDYVPSDLSLDNPLLPTTAQLISQRQYFKQAQDAIKAGDVSTALSIRDEHLQNYPLSIWIDYWYLSVNPEASKYPQVKRFIQSKAHGELSEILKKKYITYLMSVSQYAAAADLIGKKPFDDDADLTPAQQTLQCQFYESRWQRGIADVTASTFAQKMYLQLRPYPSGCSGLIYLWGENGYLNDKMRLEKFERTYVVKNYGDSTRNLANSFVGSDYENRINTAMTLYASPDGVMNLAVDNTEEQHRAAVLAFKRFANVSPRDATANYEVFAQKFKISDPEKLDIVSIIAKGFLSRQASVEEVSWVDKNLPAIAWTEEVKLMRMRKAIWFAQWSVVYGLYDHLTDLDKEQINWKYWKARAARELGYKQESKTLMTKVAKDRSFFGFLAAQELGLKMPFNHEHLSKNARWPQTVAKNQAAVRFFELRALNDANASIEWREVAKNGTKDEALMMAEWALSTGNINYAISSVIAGKRWDALDYRFPKPFLDLYKKYSNYSNVSLSFLYGISRQESMLNPDIKSPVGAVGLMQLMPATAALVSRKNNWSYNGPRELTIPENNIRLGSAYLRDMLDKFDNNRVLAAAAYNAGPGRIKIWQSKDGKTRDTAMYVENIPFKETRQYVQNVLLYDTIYRKLLTGVEGKLLHSQEKSYQY